MLRLGWLDVIPWLRNEEGKVSVAIAVVAIVVVFAALQLLLALDNLAVASVAKVVVVVIALGLWPSLSIILSDNGSWSCRGSFKLEEPVMLWHQLLVVFFVVEITIVIAGQL